MLLKYWEQILADTKNPAHFSLCQSSLSIVELILYLNNLLLV